MQLQLRPQIELKVLMMMMGMTVWPAMARQGACSNGVGGCLSVHAKCISDARLQTGCILPHTVDTRHVG